MSFKATLRVNKPSARSASHTLPAVTEQREHAVGAELPADEPRIRLDQRGDVTRHQATRLEKAALARFVLRGAQCAQQRRHFRLAPLERGEPRIPLPGRHLDRFVPERCQPLKLSLAQFFERRVLRQRIR